MKGPTKTQPGHITEMAKKDLSSSADDVATSLLEDKRSGQLLLEDKQSGQLALPDKSMTSNTGKGSSVTSRPTWRQSEIDAAKDFPDYKVQQSFIGGNDASYGEKGSVRPDYYKEGHSVDIKNYNVENSSGRSNLARNIEKQYNQRVDNLPEGTKQSVLIDIRGQNVSDADLNALYNNIMNRTNNEVEIIFKM